MKLHSRLALLAVAATGCLGAAGAASAALNATLAVGTGSPGLPAVSISTAYALSDAPVGRVQFYVPAGYTVDTAAAAGATVGTASAGVYVTDVVGEETMTGSVTVATAAPAEGQKVPNCDPVAHTATWVVNVTGTGHQWSIPLYVDKTTGSRGQLGSTKLVVCVPPPAPAERPRARPERQPAPVAEAEPDAPDQPERGRRRPLARAADAVRHARRRSSTTRPRSRRSRSSRSRSG